MGTLVHLDYPAEQDLDEIPIVISFPRPETSYQPRGYDLERRTLFTGDFQANFLGDPELVSQMKVPISVTGRAADFLKRTPDLKDMFVTIVDALDSLLTSSGADFRMRATLATDIEEPEWSALELRINVSNKEYSEILRLWDEASKSVYSSLDKRLAKRLYLIFSRAK